MTAKLISLMLVIAGIIHVLPLACVAGLISAAAFLGLAWATGGYNSLVARVVAADVVALVCLAIGAVAYLAARAGP